MMNMIFIGLGIFGICIIMIALLLLLQGDGSREQKLMQYFLVGTLIQNAGYLLELTAPTLEAAMVSVKMQYLGSIAIPITFCHFIFIYCYEKAPEYFLRLLKFIDIFVLVLVYTCNLHSLYYVEIKWLHTPEGHGYLNLSYGPGYWLFMIFGTIIPYALSLYALIRACIKKPEYAADRKYIQILVLSFLPVGALFSYSMKLTHVYDPTPVTLGLVLSTVVILVWSRKVYDFSSLASEILLNSMGDGVIALDDKRRIASYNPAAAGIFPELGIRAIGKPIRFLDSFPQNILEKDGKDEFCINGCFYQSHVKQILDRFGQNKGYVVLVLDVTETKNYIEEIKQVRIQAEQANIAKSAFLANMSHEIRTPMNAIVGLSDIIMEESRGRKVYEYACDIKAASRNLLALINDILDLSKVEAGKMELVKTEYHVKNLVGEILNMMDIVASQRGLMLKSEFDMSVPCRYLGDERRIKQILINILNNALKFTQKGYVKISVAGRKDAAPDMERLIFRIEDSGCGIREEDLKNIFENFRQVDSRRNRSVEGTGLGLSITKRLVELMQGTIAVESVYGEGTTFTLEIPQKITDSRPLSEVPEEDARKETDLKPFSATGYRVLVVDDNLINRKVAKGFLQPYGFDIEEAESGPEAIELVRKTCYDMIFMDHMMPQMDGIEAAGIIRNECGENGRLPLIIALTANAMEGVRETFLANGFQDFITKPLDKAELHKLLFHWIPEERRTVQDSLETPVQTDDDRLREFQNILIPGIDTDEVVIHYSGSAEEYRSLLDLYCLDGKRKLALLQELWDKQEIKTYGIEVHALKSASASIGAMRLSASAREHEKAADRMDTTFIDSHISRLLADYEEQLEYIQDFLGKGKTDAAKAKTGEITTEDFIQNVSDALESLENFRAKECAAKLEKLLQYKLATAAESRLEEILAQLKLYEDDAAEQMLRELIEQTKQEV